MVRCLASPKTSWNAADKIHCVLISECEEAFGCPRPREFRVRPELTCFFIFCGKQSSRARAYLYNSYCFLPSHLHRPTQPIYGTAIGGHGKTKVCLHRQPTSVTAVKAKNTTYCVVYTRAREAVCPVDAGKQQRGSRGISLRSKQNYL